MLIHTHPKNEHEEAVIARVKQLTDFKWTPIRDVPTCTKQQVRTVLEEGAEITGFPYASCEARDEFITENVSFTSFLTAIPNPYSKIYQPGRAALDACNYGIVCNGLVRYALGIPHRVSTPHWFTIPGMRMIKPAGEYTVDEILLCDILHVFGHGRNHVTIITDIIRNENGEVEAVEVSEAVRPSCRRASYTPEQFYEKYKLFSLCRYDKLDEVPPLNRDDEYLIWESGIEKVTPKVTVDRGNRSNYLVGQEVIISIFADECDTVEIVRNGEVIESIPISKRAVFSRTLKRGYYVARLKNTGDFVEFAVNQARIRHKVNDGILTVSATPCDKKSKIQRMDFRVKNMKYGGLAKWEELSESEKESGVFSRAIPENAHGFKVYFENEYGVWVHPMKRIY